MVVDEEDLCAVGFCVRLVEAGLEVVEVGFPSLQVGVDGLFCEEDGKRYFG